MAELNPTYANALFNNMLTGASVSSGDRYLAICTDGSYTEASGGSYARQDITGVMASPSEGDAPNDTVVTFTAVAAATYTHWAICTHVSDDLETTYLIRGPLFANRIMPGGTDLIVAEGDLYGSVNPIA